MKIRKKFLLCLPAVIICFYITACGKSAKAAPDSINDLVIDDSVEYDYSSFAGSWINGDNGILTFEVINGRTRYELDDGDGELIASGDLQYVEDYGCVYAYNEHDGIAHKCTFDTYGKLNIDSYGYFMLTALLSSQPSYSSGSTDNENNSDFSELEGVWYMDGETDSESNVKIDNNGNWRLYERSDSGVLNKVDSGIIEDNPASKEQYFAVSTDLDDVKYDFIVVDDNVMYWGGEYDYFRRLP